MQWEIILKSEETIFCKQHCNVSHHHLIMYQKIKQIRCYHFVQVILASYLISHPNLYHSDFM